MNVRLSIAAERDLDRIWHSIAQSSERSADSVEDRIFAAIYRLAIHPRLGKPAGLEEARQFAATGTQYVLIYEVLPDCVLILRVMHGAQDWPGRV
ncbi:plasmid stabilization system protein [Terriglobus roseus DSM 18391]|uniref:Plasmid stabilization system protein n=1 Tax=Terriglobus roseus (strain DSM 18391 / NRRL B-41598 / KBS 63) TaxID=926566 RepID=I3ZM70_TERRK|nr:type II toxin-antitoxin system RelE/ParE family toxin [Terriglobus roseus]AFL90338.1 plasmid stabilization system protein [Terriglobus roseus DSM 18391]